MKKIFTLLSITFFSLTMMANGVEVNGIYYILDSTNYTASVTYTGEEHVSSYSGDIVIPDMIVYNEKSYTITGLGVYAFYNCSTLTSVHIPSHVNTINYHTFDGCTALASVVLPNSVTSIVNYAFARCTNLTSITLSNSLTIIRHFAFSSCSQLASITIPNSVTEIGLSVFANCKKLSSVVIGSSVTSMGASVFSGCSNLTSITCLALDPPSLGNDAFKNVPRNTIPLYVPASSIPAYQAAAQWNEFDLHWLKIDLPTPDTAQLSWLPVDSASLYKLRIYSEQIELDTTLLIEADSLNGGISIPVTLAPQHNRRMPMDDIGSVVVITLEPNSGATTETPFRVTVSTTSIDRIDILFDMDVYKGKTIINEESGGFTLNAPIPDGLEDIPVPRLGVSSGIFDLYGRHYPLRQWNQLPAGIYILRDGEKTSKVMKR